MDSMEPFPISRLSKPIEQQFDGVFGPISTGVEFLPRELILRIHPNPRLHELADLSHSSFDKIVTHIPLSVPDHVTRQLLKPSDQERVNPVMHALNPNQIIGYKAGTEVISSSVITAKGVLPSGQMLAEFKSGTNKENAYGTEGYGLFRLDLALQDLEISNQLLANGLRSALHLGVIELNPEKLKQFIHQHWSNNPELETLMNDRLKDFLDKGYTPAILLRAFGTLDRPRYGSVFPLMFGLHGSVEKSPVEKRIIQRTKHQIIRAAQILAINNPRFSDLAEGMTSGDFSIGTIFFRELTRMCENQFDLLCDYLDDHPEHASLATSFFDGKDMDYTLVTADFDHALDPVESQSHQSTYSSMRQYLEEYEFLLKKTNILPDK